jgi:hypothetical protein
MNARNDGISGSSGMNMNSQPVGQGYSTRRRRSTPLIVTIVVIACCLLVLCLTVIVLITQGVINIPSLF